MRLSCNSLSRIVQYASRIETQLGSSVLRHNLPTLDTMWLRSLRSASSKYPTEVQELVLPRLTKDLYALQSTDIASLGLFLARSRLAESAEDPVISLIHECPYLLSASTTERIKRHLEQVVGQKIETLFIRNTQKEFDVTGNAKHTLKHFGVIPAGMRVRVNKEHNYFTLKSLLQKVNVRIVPVSHNAVAELDYLFTEVRGEDWDIVAADFPRSTLTLPQLLASIHQQKSHFRLNPIPNVVQRQEFGMARIDPMLSVAAIRAEKGKEVAFIAPSYEQQVQFLGKVVENEESYKAFCEASQMEMGFFLKGVETKGCNFCNGRKEIPLAKSLLSAQLFAPYRDWYYWQLSSALLPLIQTNKRVLLAVHSPMQFPVMQNLMRLLRGEAAPSYPAYIDSPSSPLAEAMIDPCLRVILAPGPESKELQAARSLQLTEVLREWKLSKNDKSCFAVAQLKKQA